jgi:hypothetical protein
MGLGINIKGEIKKPLLSIIKKPTDLKTIQKYITEHSVGIFKTFLSFSESENNLYVTLHPCEETIYFEMTSDTVILCSAKTNSVGPGYHAYLVEFIEKMGSDLNISWHWDLEEGEEYYQDETGYYQHRDYKQLQLEMLKWLRALCRAYDEDENGEQIMVCLPIGFPRMKLDYFAVSSVQIWTKEWFSKVAALEPEDLYWAGEEFFIWWNKEPDMLFYKQTGIALLNVECPWHIPADEKERTVLTMIDQCFEQSRKFDPFVDLPEEDWTAIKNLMNESDLDIPQTDYGYRKHVMTFDLPDKWLIDLPGTMYHDTEENTEVYYDHIRTVRSLAYSLSEKDKTDAEFAETFFDNNENVSAGTEALYSTNGLAGKAIVHYAIDKEIQTEYWILQGVKVKDNKFLLSTICYPTEEYKDWAIETWNSVRL